MNASPHILGLFQKRLAGDDALLELARLRFEEVAMDPEIHAGSPEDFLHQHSFRPENACTVVVHFPRNWSLLNADDHEQIRRMARCAAGKAHGFVIHDLKEMERAPELVVRQLRKLAALLREIPESPVLFVEYAVGIDPGRFVETLQRVKEHREISACIDIGHIGIRQARRAYAERYPGEDPCALTPESRELPDRIDALIDSARIGLRSTVEVIRETAVSGKPLHFHLHDGHPLAKSSYGVPDHRGFLEPIPIPFVCNGRRSLPPLFGPAGLRKIVDAARTRAGAGYLTFTFEIHETHGRLPLGNAEPLFGNWNDTGNAEQMNHWLSSLQNHAELLRAGWE